MFYATSLVEIRGRYLRFATMPYMKRKLGSLRKERLLAPKSIFSMWA